MRSPAQRRKLRMRLADRLQAPRSKRLGDEHASEGQIEMALREASPERHAALRAAEAEFATALAKAGVEQARIAADDRADARQRHIAMRDWTPAILGSIIVLGFFIVLAAMVLRQLPSGAETEFSIMLGGLAAMTAAVVNFYLGSSAGSKEKTDILAAVQRGANGE